ncbi:MAG: hypothetical protein IPK76_06725 [Lewinellaceae bacterium]|nr:hypothetical protein [Lewinellaceae bacterium]
MKKSIRLLASLLFPAIWLLLFACEKETPPTVINGKVTDRKTGMPVEGARIDIDFQTEKTVSGSLKTDHEYVSFSTDAQGKFHYTHNADYTSTYSELYKEGYGSYGPLIIEKGETNDLDITLSPIDGTLRLEITNQSGQFDSIYIIIESPSLIDGPVNSEKIFTDTFPVTLPFNGTHIEYFDLPSEEFTKIHWGFVYFTSLSESVYIDSVFLALHDTTVYNLVY